MKTVFRRGERRIEGLGDLIHGVAKITGVAAVAKTYEKTTGKDCGCAARRESWNKKFPLG